MRGFISAPNISFTKVRRRKSKKDARKSILFAASNCGGSSSKDGSGLFVFLGDGVLIIFGQIVSIRAKTASRHIRREKRSIPVDIRRAKTTLLKRPIIILKRTSVPRLLAPLFQG